MRNKKLEIEENSSSLLFAEKVRVHYPIRGGLLNKIIGYVHAVENASIQIKEGEIVSLVGESGCGKSSLGMALMGLIEASSGKIKMKDEILDIKNRQAFQKFRQDYQIIFQDPYSALNPRQTAYEILAEPLLFHDIVSKKKVEYSVVELLEKVGLSIDHLHLYPHSFSGGQRQRLCIARAISLRPKLIVCDEIVSALDLSVQAQIVELLVELRKEMGLSLLWISHDLSLVRNISDYVYVMYFGKIVEVGKCPGIFINPSHPYTKALVSAIPTLNKAKKPALLYGEPPSPRSRPSGCTFHTRCPKHQEKCKKMLPSLEKNKNGNEVACFYPENG